MAFTIGTSSSSVATAKPAGRRNAQVQAPVRARVVVQAHKAEHTIQESTRREVLGAVALSCASLLAASPAQAFLGIGDDGKEIQEVYSNRTTTILAQVQETLAIDKGDPTKEDKVKELRKDINGWVATYRREAKVSGRPSFGQTYSVLNALAGHYNSFGATAPIPKKRLERINKEIADATTYLARGR